MIVNFEVTGEKRKQLVQAISKIVGVEPVYTGAPTFSYRVSDFTIDRNGTLSVSTSLDAEQIKKLLEDLARRGFPCADKESADRLIIEVPLTDITDEVQENLHKIIASKANLIKKAIGAQELPIERTETTLQFPWFSTDASGDEVAAYSFLIDALLTAAKDQKRVTAKEKDVENEKFAFRVFLIRLGFVGDVYKGARKILLSRLSGNAAFKNGKPESKEGTEE